MKRAIQQQGLQQFQTSSNVDTQPNFNNSETGLQANNQNTYSNSDMDVGQFQNQNSQQLNSNQNQYQSQNINPASNSLNLGMNQFPSINLNQNMSQSQNSAYQNGSFPSALNPPSVINQPYYYPGIVQQPQSIPMNDNLVQRDDFSQLQKRVIVIEQVLSQILPKYQNQSLFQPKICSACNSKPGLNICPVCGNSFCQEDFYAHVAKGCKH